MYAGMWRVVLPDGSLSDMANLTRAKDAAFVIADVGAIRASTNLNFNGKPSAKRRPIVTWKTHARDNENIFAKLSKKICGVRNSSLRVAPDAVRKTW